eukprot:g37848.t1
MDSVKDGGLMVHDGVVVKGELGHSVGELAFGLCDIEVGPPDYHCPIFVSGFDSETGIGEETVERCMFGGGEVGVVVGAGEVEAVDVTLAVSNEEVQGGAVFEESSRAEMEFEGEFLWVLVNGCGGSGTGPEPEVVSEPEVISDWTGLMLEEVCTCAMVMAVWGVAGSSIRLDKPDAGR